VAIGNYYYILSKNILSRIIIRFLGTIDLHTHIRLKPVIDYLNKFLLTKSGTRIKILELGCGTGVSAFEINKISRRVNINFEYTGVDFSSELITIAKRVLKTIQPVRNKINFICDDVINFLVKNNERVDVILLLDIIEHINNPERLLFYSNNLLNKHGMFLISVPTPLYPEYFGYKFHQEMGHLVKGYALDDLVKMFNDINCEIVFYKYNTGIMAKYGCSLYYKIFYSQKRASQIIKFLFLFPFKYLDFINNSKVSCSLFVVFRKKN